MFKNYSQQQGHVIWYILAIAVILIVGFFVFVGPAALDSSKLITQDANRATDIKQIVLAAELFAYDNQGQYPRVSSELLGPEYLVNGVPTDPETGEPYSYTVSNDKTYVTVCATLSNQEQQCLSSQDL